MAAEGTAAVCFLKLLTKPSTNAAAAAVAVVATIATDAVAAASSAILLCTKHWHKPVNLSLLSASS